MSDLSEKKLADILDNTAQLGRDIQTLQEQNNQTQEILKMIYNNQVKMINLLDIISRK
ncbi:MAG: hypothetical protein ACK5KL_01240 [Dysgonomonas sp.]